MNLNLVALQKDLEYYFSEDDISRNVYYTSKLPSENVQCQLKIKDDLVLAGVPWFIETFRFLGAEGLDDQKFYQHEGKTFSKSEKFEIEFELPFGLALTGERIALNLLQRASSIATHTRGFVAKASEYKIAILDTRKTTPGHRALEKYAVRTGGGYNHRFGQTDMWMVKDNHKSFFGGIEKAVEFFRDMQGFYAPIDVEIHDLNELSQAVKAKVNHVMLDNFSPDEVREAIKVKPAGMTYEISGGITIDTLESYLIDGVDAISVGSLTYGAPSVDLSLKYAR